MWSSLCVKGGKTPTGLTSVKPIQNPDIRELDSRYAKNKPLTTSSPPNEPYDQVLMTEKTANTITVQLL
jgi:hypothetical protein